MSKKEKEIKFNTENDLNVAIIKDGKDLLINEDCCTCINIMLKNDGQILTSFLGSHNAYIVSQLEQAQKYYFKSLKKALKAQTLDVEYGNCSCDEHCECEHEHGCDCEECGCDETCNCDEVGDCNCGPDCNCGCQEGKECTCETEEQTSKKKTNKVKKLNK